MNAPEGSVKFVPKQAISPTPQLYDELVSDSMENLAKASIELIPPLGAGAVVHDIGCGTGAGTAAVMATLGSSSSAADVTIKATDINEGALQLLRQRASEGGWPVEAETADAAALGFADGTFTHVIGNALLFVLPNDGIGAVKETYRTLRPGGTALFNSWAYLPNLPPLRAAAEATRPEGTPLPRAGTDKWSDPEFLRGVVERGGFAPDKIQVRQVDVHTTASEMERFANMLWSFIGGTTVVGWLESDEERWDEAIEVIKAELKKTDGYVELEDGRSRLKFVANVAIATK